MSIVSEEATVIVVMKTVFCFVLKLARLIVGSRWNLQ